MYLIQRTRNFLFCFKHSHPIKKYNNISFNTVSIFQDTKNTQVKVIPSQSCLDKDLINCMFDLKHMNSPYETYEIKKIETKMILPLMRCMHLIFSVKNQFCLRIYILKHLLCFFIRIWNIKLLLYW